LSTSVFAHTINTSAIGEFVILKIYKSNIYLTKPSKLQQIQVGTRLQV
jgi:hypothetical protein